MGLGDRCFWVLEPTAKMPQVVSEVLSMLDGGMRTAHHHWQERSRTKIGSLQLIWEIPDCDTPAIVSEESVASAALLKSRCDPILVNQPLGSSH